MKKTWFKFNNFENSLKNDFEAKKNNQNLVECFIYDEIGGFGITASDFVTELKHIDKITNQNANFVININSPGGDVFDGLAIYNALQELGERCTAVINGIAASAASLIACGANEVIMCETALLMIHNPFTSVVGNAVELRKVADTLDKCNNSIITAYQRKCKNLSAEKITEMMDAETWLDAEDAVALGFADVIRSFDEEHKNEQKQPSITNKVFNRMKFKNTPKNLLIIKDLKEIKMTEEVKEIKEVKEVKETEINNEIKNEVVNEVNEVNENEVNENKKEIKNDQTLNLMLKVFDTCKNANINNFEEVGKASLQNFCNIDFSDSRAENIINAECERITNIKNLCDLSPLNSATDKDNLLVEFVKNNLSLEQVRANLFDLIVNNQAENKVDNAIPVVEDENDVSNSIPTPEEVYSKRKCGK